VVLLEKSALLADRRAREPPEAAGEQPHPDSGGVKVDGRDDSIGPHGHLTLRDVCIARCRAEIIPQTRPRSTAG
jgi:hypothetical protein